MKLHWGNLKLITLGSDGVNWISENREHGPWTFVAGLFASALTGKLPWRRALGGRWDYRQEFVSFPWETRGRGDKWDSTSVSQEGTVGLSEASTIYKHEQESYLIEKIGREQTCSDRVFYASILVLVFVKPRVHLKLYTVVSKTQQWLFRKLMCSWLSDIVADVSDERRTKEGPALLLRCQTELWFREAQTRYAEKSECAVPFRQAFIRFLQLEQAWRN